MSRTTIWKLFPITCIIVFAAAGVSIGHSEMLRITGQSNDEAVALRTALPLCPSLQGQVSRPANAIYRRYLAHTPIAHVAVR
jgi:hypothetical protein